MVMTRAILRVIAAQHKMPKRMDYPSSAILGLFFCFKKWIFVDGYKKVLGLKKFSYNCAQKNVVFQLCTKKEKLFSNPVKNIVFYQNIQKWSIKFWSIQDFVQPITTEYKTLFQFLKLPNGL